MYFSVVFQDYKLLSLKLGDNVSSGTKYNKEDVISCLSKAGFNDSLDKMKEGIDTYLFKEILLIVIGLPPLDQNPTIYR